MQVTVGLLFFIIICFSTRLGHETAALAFAVLYLGISRAMTEHEYNETLNNSDE